MVTQSKARGKMYNKKWKDWYLENYDQEFNDENGYQRKEGMDDETYAIGKNLYNNYIAGQNATNVYDNAVTEVDTQKFKDSKQLEATYQKLMKYLPEINASQGIGNLGIAQSTYVGATNNYQNNLGAVNVDANKQKTSLLENYRTALAENEINANDNESGIRADWVNQYKAAAESMKTDVYNMMTGYIAADNAEAGKAKAQAYIDKNKSKLGNQYEWVQAYLDTFDTEPAVKTPIAAEEAIGQKLTYEQAQEKGVDLSKYTAKAWAEATGTTYTPTNTIADTGISTFKASNGKTIDETSNNAGRQYEFTIDNSTYSIKAERDDGTLKTLTRYREFTETEQSGLSSMKANTFYYINRDGVELLIYKRNDGSYVTFRKGVLSNSSSINAAGFNKLKGLASNYKKRGRLSK